MPAGAEPAAAPGRPVPAGVAVGFDPSAVALDIVPVVDGRSPELEKAMATALAMLARRDYSRAGLGRRLLRKGYAATVVEGVCQRCVDTGYVDDRSYGRSRLLSRLERRPCGRPDAIDDLRGQGLTTTMIESVVEEVYAEVGGEAAVLQAALDRWCARHGEPEELAAAKRCFDHLLRRRFPRSLVRDVLSPWLDEIMG